MTQAYHAPTIEAQQLTDYQVEALGELAKRDDWHCRLVGSDVRQLVGDLQRARAAIRALPVSPVPATKEASEPLEWDGPLTDGEQAMLDAAWETHKAAAPCTIPPAGWSCTRAAGHDGPCAARPAPPIVERVLRPADGSVLPHSVGWRIVRSVNPEGPDPQLLWERVPTPSDAIGETVEKLREGLEPTSEQQQEWASAILKASNALYCVARPMQDEISKGLQAAIAWATFGEQSARTLLTALEQRDAHPPVGES